MFIVEGKVLGKICQESLGGCEQFDERCKAKHGPTAQGNCESRTSNICTCGYWCGPPLPPPEPKVCYGGAGMCSKKCWKQCCNQVCASMFFRGVGFCESFGSIYLCKCQYPC